MKQGIENGKPCGILFDIVDINEDVENHADEIGN